MPNSNKKRYILDTATYIAGANLRESYAWQAEHGAHSAAKPKDNSRSRSDLTEYEPKLTNDQ
jgi:hypothetical protein